MVTDLFIFIAEVFTFAVAMVIIGYAGFTLNDVMMDIAPQLSNDGLIPGGQSVNGTAIVESTFGVLTTAFESLKWISYMLIIGLGISILVSNFLVRTHPMFVIPYIFIVAIAVVVAVPISNTYEILHSHELLGSYFQGFIGLTYIFANFPLWILLFGILGGILMFINIPRDETIGDSF